MYSRRPPKLSNPCAVRRLRARPTARPACQRCISRVTPGFRRKAGALPRSAEVVRAGHRGALPSTGPETAPGRRMLRGSMHVSIKVRDLGEAIKFFKQFLEFFGYHFAQVIQDPMGSS